MTEIDVATLRARWNGAIINASIQREKMQEIANDLNDACDALDAARLENANHEKLVRDAYSFAERMLPVVEAARAVDKAFDLEGPDWVRDHALDDLHAVVAEYEKNNVREG